MSRPRSEERQAEILAAATRVIASQGLAATTTSSIAKEAGVSNGSLFVYFDTKTALLNELFLVLKSEMGDAAFAELPGAAVREQVQHMWTRWLSWATTFPEKRRALAQLEVAEDITTESRRTVAAAQQDMADLIERARSGGPLAAAPLSLALALTSAMADATMDSLLRDPAATAEHVDAAFDAVWRVLAG